MSHWTPEGALAYIVARPGDATADEIIRDLTTLIREHEKAEEKLAAALVGSHWRGHLDKQAAEALDAFLTWATERRAGLVGDSE